MKWYDEHARDLPWRQTKNPYAVWLSEIILQQTRVDQGTPYFHRFIEQFPTVIHLANASEDQVLKLWQGLGYYSRARNLHKTAQIIRDQHNGNFPQTAKALRAFPGIGPYTSAAIASICFDEAVAVVDGNVHRVISRLFETEGLINHPNGYQQFQDVAHELMPPHRPGDFNQAMMELGARICTPQQPKCISCPLQCDCLSRGNNTIHRFPTASLKPAKKVRYFNFLIIRPKPHHLLIERRTSRDIWKNLHQFPMIETEKMVEYEALIQPAYSQLGLQLPDIQMVSVIRPIKHQLTHQTILASFWDVGNSHVRFGENCNIFEVDLSALTHSYAVPVIVKNYLNTLTLP